MTKQVNLRRLAVLLAVWIMGGEALSTNQLTPPVWNNLPRNVVSGVEHRTFFSRTVAADVGYSTLLPPEYALGQRRYPVVYWLHGAGGNENSDPVNVAPVIVEAMKRGTVPPFIVIFVNGRSSFYPDSPDGRIPAETVFISELVPHVDATYRTIAERRSRAIEGFSMGGFGALAHGMRHVDLFGSVVAYAPALLEVQRTADGTLTLGRDGGTHEGASTMPAELVAFNHQTFQKMFGGRPELFDKYSPRSILRKHAQTLRGELPVRIVIGTADGLWNANQLFHKLMLDKGYDHEFETVQDVAHSLGPLYKSAGIKGLAFHARAGKWR